MKTIAIYENRDKQNAVEYARSAAKMLNSMGARLIADPGFISLLNDTEQGWIEPVEEKDFGKIADAVVSFGGDGTILRLSKRMLFSDVPVMGINVGRLGFLAEYRAQELEEAMNCLVKGNYRVVDRSLLVAVVEGEKYYALNDIVIERKLTSRMITIEAYANNSHIADYRADGLIVTTPTGSTAYSLSCGGPILAPNCQVFCITPISPHSLNLRPLVVSDDNELNLVPHSHDHSTHLVLDGQEQLTIANGQSIVIRKSEANIKLIKPQSGSYFSLLKEKLNWASYPVQG
jgi:NAD+ kinase